MRAVRACRELCDVARLELPLAGRGPQRRPAAQDDEQLVVAVVEVVRALRLSRQQLVQAGPDVAVRDPPVARPPAVRCRTVLVPLAAVDVHAASFGPVPVLTWA